MRKGTGKRGAYERRRRKKKQKLKSIAYKNQRKKSIEKLLKRKEKKIEIIPFTPFESIYKKDFKKIEKLNFLNNQNYITTNKQNLFLLFITKKLFNSYRANKNIWKIRIANIEISKNYFWNILFQIKFYLFKKLLLWNKYNIYIDNKYLYFYKKNSIIK